MAVGKIQVDFSRLRSVSQSVSNKAADYESKYTQLYNAIDELRNAWSGTDNVAYTERIEAFRNDFEYMKSLMDEYSSYLSKTANTYEETQNEIASKAKNLRIDR
ncbi:MAG: WXG100 family type VII secretion target [Eubacteriales bacterium]|nr:WXG100 family type VII secretion target [Eubacteriales bacterium]